jgi:hypothetical protein
MEKLKMSSKGHQELSLTLHSKGIAAAPPSQDGRQAKSLYIQICGQGFKTIQIHFSAIAAKIKKMMMMMINDDDDNDDDEDDDDDVDDDDDDDDGDDDDDDDDDDDKDDDDDDDDGSEHADGDNSAAICLHSALCNGQYATWHLREQNYTFKQLTHFLSPAPLQLVFAQFFLG